ncbi:MAG: hypothetical protein HC769_21680 [Cyanobacteria bacterium CRU_2_1]|nr:hypothetical protein [Cyanobacteria bacterium CRU_2_1]
MPQNQPPDGHWQWVPSETRTPDRPNRSSAAGTALFLIGVLMISQVFVGWRGLEAFRRVFDKRDAQIQQVNQQQ